MFAEPSLQVVLAVLIVLGVLTIVFVASTMKAFASKKSGWGIFAAITGLLTIGIVGYVTLNLAHDEDLVLPASKVFESNDGISAVTGPVSWANLSSGPKDASMSIGNSKNGEFLVVITEGKSELPEGFTLRNYAVAASLSISNSLNYPKSTELSEFQLNGARALRNAVSGEAGDSSIDFFNTYVEGNEHFHQVRCWTDRDNREVSFPILRKAADTFHELRK